MEDLLFRMQRQDGFERVIEETRNFDRIVKGVYEIPEVRSVTPGHLVRCGHSSTFDVNFGMEVGGSAVLLLQNGLSGVTVVGLHGDTIGYLPTPEAIKPRFVDLNLVAFYEDLGIFFGRKPVKNDYKIQKFSGPIERHL